MYSKTTKCCVFFDIKNIKIGFKYLEIRIFVIKPTKSVSFYLKRPNTLKKSRSTAMDFTYIYVLYKYVVLIYQNAYQVW